MNEKFEQFRKELESKTPEELEQGYNNFIKAIHNLPIDYDESMKELAKVRGKDENHYLDNEEKKPFFKGYKPPYYFRNTTEEENEAYSKGLKEISESTGIKLFEDNNNSTGEIKIGAIIVVNDNGKNKKYQLLDNSKINPEYPIAILDIEQHKIVQTSVSANHMRYGGYIFIDKEYEIIDVR